MGRINKKGKGSGFCNSKRSKDFEGRSRGKDEEPGEEAKRTSPFLTRFRIMKAHFILRYVRIDRSKIQDRNYRGVGVEHRGDEARGPLRKSRELIAPEISFTI